MVDKGIEKRYFVTDDNIKQCIDNAVRRALELLGGITDNHEMIHSNMITSKKDFVKELEHKLTEEFKEGFENEFHDVDILDVFGVHGCEFSDYSKLNGKLLIEKSFVNAYMSMELKNSSIEITWNVGRAGVEPRSGVLNYGDVFDAAKKWKELDDTFNNDYCDGDMDEEVYRAYMNIIADTEKTYGSPEYNKAKGNNYGI